jgi:hypothetical protein
MTCFRHHGRVRLLETANTCGAYQVASRSEYPKAGGETVPYRE